MRKGWDIMLDEVFDEQSLKETCKKYRGAKYDGDKKIIRFSGSDEKLNEVSRSIKQFARIWGVILLWTIGG